MDKIEFDLTTYNEFDLVGDIYSNPIYYWVYFGTDDASSRISEKIKLDQYLYTDRTPKVFTQKIFQIPYYPTESFCYYIIPSTHEFNIHNKLDEALALKENEYYNILKGEALLNLVCLS